MATANYLIRRAEQALRLEKLEYKDLSLDMLMTAFVSKNGDDNNDARISMKVSGLATLYATKLVEGKFVYFRDIYDNRLYFVKAFEGELIAVTFAIGPWMNLFFIKATSEHVLKQLNIKSPTINDPKIIDGIFGFRPESDDDEVVVTPAAAVEEPNARWAWHTPVIKKPRKEVLAEPTEIVEVPAGAVDHGAVEHAELETAGGKPSNQMEHAFHTAGTQRGQERREERRGHQGGERRHVDQSSKPRS